MRRPALRFHIVDGVTERFGVTSQSSSGMDNGFVWIVSKILLRQCWKTTRFCLPMKCR
nr:MAG TPA: hypothetical protein [Caudoviricetes sp.]